MKHGDLPSLLDFALSNADNTSWLSWKNAPADHAWLIYQAGGFQRKRFRSFSKSTWKVENEQHAEYDVENFLPESGFASFEHLHNTIIAFQSKHQCKDNRLQRRSKREPDEVKRLRHELKHLNSDQSLHEEYANLELSRDNARLRKELVDQIRSLKISAAKERRESVFKSKIFKGGTLKKASKLHELGPMRASGNVIGQPSSRILTSDTQRIKEIEAVYRDRWCKDHLENADYQYCEDMLNRLNDCWVGFEDGVELDILRTAKKSHRSDIMESAVMLLPFS